MRKFTLNFLGLVMALFTCQSTMAQDDVVFTETFEQSNGEFVEEGENGAAPTSNVWLNSAGSAKADAYGKIEGAYTSYFVSPEITLLNKNCHAVSIVYCFTSYGSATYAEQIGVSVREVGGEWENLEMPFCSVTEGAYKESGDIIIPESYNGKTVQVALRYYAESSNGAGVWNIDELVVKNTVPTAIEGVEAENNGDIIYDLQGNRVFNPSNGIFVVNGKKIVIK